MSDGLPEGVEVTGSVPTEHAGILSREALAFVADLARGFDPSAHRAVGALVQRHDVPRRQPEDLLEGERVGLHRLVNLTSPGS